MIAAADVEAAINPDDVHKARTSLVCLEKHLQPRRRILLQLGRDRKDQSSLYRTRPASCTWTAPGCSTHCYLSGETPAQYGQVFNSISVCLNKGLRLPHGLRTAEQRSISSKKRGAFAKSLAEACARPALWPPQAHLRAGTSCGRLADDHAHAKMIAAAAVGTKRFTGHMLPVETNILIFECTAAGRP